MPFDVVSPTSLSLLNESYTLSLYSAPISMSLVDFSNANPNAATTPPNIFTAVPTPVNIITPPIKYNALDTVSFKSFIALAPTLAPRSPLNKASAIPVAALTTPLITDVAKVSPAAIPTLLPVISNIFSCIWFITPSRLLTLVLRRLNSLTGSSAALASSRSLLIRLSNVSSDCF